MDCWVSSSSPAPGANAARLSLRDLPGGALGSLQGISVAGLHAWGKDKHKIDDTWNLTSRKRGLFSLSLGRSVPLANQDEPAETFSKRGPGHAGSSLSGDVGAAISLATGHWPTPDAPSNVRLAVSSVNDRPSKAASSEELSDLHVAWTWHSLSASKNWPGRT